MSKCIFPLVQSDVKGLLSMLEIFRARKIAKWKVSIGLFLHVQSLNKDARTVPQGSFSRDLFIVSEDIVPVSAIPSPRQYPPKSTLVKINAVPSKIKRTTTTNTTRNKQNNLRSAKDPKQMYLVCGNAVTEIDATMEILLAKTKIYQRRQTVLIDSGFVWQIGDFGLKMGSIYMGNSARGYIMELEYRPCKTVNGALDIMKEFLHSLGLAYLATDFKNYNILPLSSEILDVPSHYTMQHTAYQYTQFCCAIGAFGKGYRKRQ